MVTDPQHSEFNLSFTQPVRGEFDWRLNDQQGPLLTVSYRDNELVLKRRGKDGLRYATLPAGLTNLQIFVDTSSVEIFVNDGWVSLTDRYYATGAVSYEIASDQPVTLTAANYALD